MTHYRWLALLDQVPSFELSEHSGGNAGLRRSIGAMRLHCLAQTIAGRLQTLGGGLIGSKRQKGA
jgi:hypothetical protein